MAYKYHCLNPIAKVGLDNFDAQFFALLTLHFFSSFF